MTTPSPLRRFGVNAKLSVFFSSIVVVIVLAFSGISFYLQFQALQATEARSLALLTSNFADQVDSQQRQAASLATSLAANGDLRQAIIENDRTLLLALLQPVYLDVRDNFNVNTLSFISSEGTVLLRLHAPGRLGDSVLFRGLVADALASRQLVSGLEVDATSISNRAIVPVFEGTTLLGFVEVGFDITPILSALKERTESDYQLWLTYAAVQQFGLAVPEGGLPSPNDDFFYYAGTVGQAFSFNATDFSLEQSQIIYTSDAAGALWALQVAPLAGYNRPLGVLVAGLPRDATLTALFNALIFQLLVGGVLLASGLLGVTLVSRVFILRPLGILTQTTRRQLRGEWSAQAMGLPNDEFGELGAAFNTLSQQLEGQIQNQERVIAERTLQLETTFAVSRRLSTILDPQTLVLNVVEQVREAFGYYHVHIYLFDDTREYLVMMGGTGEAGQQLLARNHRVPRDRGLVGRAARTNLLVHVPDTRQEATWLPNPLLPDTQSEIAVPVSVGDDVLGVLDVQQNVPNAFSDGDIEVLEAIANQVAVGLQNARSYEVTRRRAEREAALNSLARKLQATTSLESALQVAARELAYAFQANRAGAHLSAAPTRSATDHGE